MLAVVGVANSVEDVAGFTLLQRVVPDALLTRVLGVVWGVAMGALALGSIAAPGVVRAIGPRPALVVVGSILPLLTFLTWGALVNIDRTVRAPAEELAVIDGVGMFAPLSIAAKEHVAGTLRPLSVAAGEVGTPDPNNHENVLPMNPRVPFYNRMGNSTFLHACNQGVGQLTGPPPGARPPGSGP